MFAFLGVLDISRYVHRLGEGVVVVASPAPLQRAAESQAEQTKRLLWKKDFFRSISLFYKRLCFFAKSGGCERRVEMIDMGVVMVDNIMARRFRADYPQVVQKALSIFLSLEVGL